MAKKINETGQTAFSYQFKGFHIPARMMAGLQRYIEYGIEPGGFLQAVISNDLAAAVGKADDENIRNLPAFVGYLYNEAPSLCWGSKNSLESWIEMGGKQGISKTGDTN